MITKGRNRAEMRHRMVVGEVRAAGRGGARGGGRNRGAPCRLIHQGGPCRPCGDVRVVRRAEGSPAVRNCSGGQIHLNRAPVKLPELQVLRSSKIGLGRLLVLGRTFYGGWPRLGYSRAAWPRRRRGVARRS